MTPTTIRFSGLLPWVLAFGAGLGVNVAAVAQAPSGGSAEPAPRRAEFAWVNSIPPKLQHPRLKHATFVSPSLRVEVGYCIYLPPLYDEPGYESKRFPVVYYLHGGRPGSETKSIGLVNTLHRHISAGEVPPMIYVFLNGGPVSHYNLPDRPDAQGESVFVKELIPHVDSTWRTIAARKGRGIEGFSQGGRGTARIMFRYPELFVSAAPGGGGYATEKRISENDGYENPNLRFAPGDNVWDLARNHAKQPEPALNILFHVGTEDFNYECNLEYMQLLEKLNIPFRRIIVPDAPHSAKAIYDQQGLEIMKFHAAIFGG